jgi:hypothetical protein
MLRFHSPLIEPDERISRIRLSDWLSSPGIRKGPSTQNVQQPHEAQCRQVFARRRQLRPTGLVEAEARLLLGLAIQLALKTPDRFRVARLIANLP